MGIVIIFFSFGYSHNGVSYPFPPPTLHIPSCLHHILLRNNISNRYLFKILISEKSSLRYSGVSEMVLICPFQCAKLKDETQKTFMLNDLKVNSPQINILATVGFRKIVRRDRKISHLTFFYINLTYNHPLLSTGACPSILMESRCPLISIVIQVAIDTLLSRRTSVIYLSCTGHTS